jgi:hypothetical protein
MERTIEIGDGAGNSFQVQIAFDGQREGGMIVIDGTSYHFERMLANELKSSYRVDLDPDYEPQHDAEGYCYIIAPFSK